MPTSIRLDPDVERRLDNLAASTGRSKAFYLREMITAGLQDLEDYYQADAVVRRIETGEEAVYALDQVVSQLGLED